MVEQCGQIQALVPQRIAVGRQLAAAVTAAVIDKAAKMPREMRHLVLEEGGPVGLAMNEDEVRPGAVLLVIEIAIIDGGDRHDFLRTNPPEDLSLPAKKG